MLQTGAEVRQSARSGQLKGPTPGMAPGFVQTNLVVVPPAVAFDFLLFCQRNPKPCPLLEVVEGGQWEPQRTAPGADLRFDAPRYCVYRRGELTEEPYDLEGQWQDDFVSFLLGCSFTFENALMESGIPVRHIEQGSNVPMYKTSIPCERAGTFHGSMVVSMRPLGPKDAIAATQICGHLRLAHGAPVHWGDPGEIGIRDIGEPDYGDPVEIKPGEAPVFWACGVTPQLVAVEAKPELLITHKPGHMFVTDWRDRDLWDR